MNYQEALKTLELADPPHQSEVKSSFRKKALQYHPDRNPDDQKAADQFRLCADAYNFLIENVQAWHGKRGPRDQQGTVSYEQTVQDLENIFDDIFGFSREGRILGYQKPQIIFLNLMQLAYGTTLDQKMAAYETCRSCHGRGGVEKSRVVICTHCFGRGTIQVESGLEQKKKLCPRCKGRGRRIDKPCQACGGWGRIEKMAGHRLALPRGLNADGEYTLHGQNKKTGQQNELFIRLALVPHPVFKVDKSDVLCEYPVGQGIADKGGRLKVAGVWGYFEVRIPAGTKSGHLTVVPSAGLVRHPGSGQKGDLHLRIMVTKDAEAQKLQKRFLAEVARLNPAYKSIKKFWWQRFFH